MTVTNRERVMAALRGEPVDRVPLAFWMHNFATENSAKDLAAETLRLAREFGWDYLKPQSRAQCFAEMWGLRYRPSGERAVPYTVTVNPCAGAGDLARLAPVDPRTASLGDQLEALRLIRSGVGPDTPIIWTVFSPLMVVPYLLPGGREQALAIMRSEPGVLEHALDTIAQTLAGYTRACLEAGADGLFYATNITARDLVTAEECRRFQRQYDLRILAAAAPAPFNVLHVCGTGVRFEEFADYPVHAVSWAVVPENPTLREGHERTGHAAMGGLPAKPAIASFTPEALADRARAAAADMQGRWLLLGPDCSINPDTPDRLMHATRATLDG
jgi:uroporphyrinogen decarboxylase